MKACYDFPKNDVVFPFNLTEYLFTDVTPLADIVHEHIRILPKNITPEAVANREKLRKEAFMRTLKKYIAAMDHYGGEATARQIAMQMNYALHSTGSNLTKLAKSCSIIKFRMISREEAIKMGVSVGTGRKLKLWSYDLNGIIFPQKGMCYDEE